jgi:hypothetical protein
MKNILVLLIATTTLITAHSQGELPIDLNTGRPIISIPIATISNHEISESVNLVYDASGVRVQQPSGNYGIGWDLQAGGSIRREVRSLPDDFYGFNTDPRRGWLYTNPATGVPFGADIGNFNTASSEATQYGKLNGFNYIYDTEPDVFYYNFGGITGKFVLDNSNPSVVHLVPLADLKVDMQWDTDLNKITGFVITTNDGIKYTFDKTYVESKTTYALNGAVEFFKNDYTLYKTSTSYHTEWKLTKVQSPLGATLTYTFIDLYPITAYDTAIVSIKNSSGNGYTRKKIYYTKKTYTPSRISSIISSSGTTVSINNSTQVSKITIQDSRRIIGNNSNLSYVKEYDLSYSTVTVNSYPRYFLSTLQEKSGCDQLPPYKFSYVGASDNQNLPSPDSKSIDFWGYYNNRVNTTLAPTAYYYPLLANAEQYRLYPIPGYVGTSYSCVDADRTPDPTAMLLGTLNFIQYPYGGYTSIIYEPHQYYDAQSLQTYIGGGLRVKSVTYFDGVRTNGTIVKNLVYTDSTSTCSGRLVSRPLFALPTKEYRDPITGTVINKGTDWSYLTARTEEDISLQETSSGSPVIYQEVKIYRPGSGWARHEFLCPGMYGTTATGNWTPTTNSIARSNTSLVTGGVITSGTWTFANAPNPNFEHERGLVWRKREYNEANIEVRRTRTYYQYLYKTKASTSPYTIYGIRYEYYPYSSTSSTPNNTFSYSKYNWLADVAKVTFIEKVTNFDVASNSKYNFNLTEYAYESDNHRLLNRKKETAPDGTLYSTRMVYPLDYGTIPVGADTTSQMIGNLVSTFRNGSPIEQYTTVLKSGVGEVEKQRLALLRDSIISELHLQYFH